MRNSIHAALLSAAAAVFWCRIAVAQSCPPLAISGLDQYVNTCVSTCCSTLTSCYGARNCNMSADWPNAVSSQCALCNQDYITCRGLCLTTDAFRARYLFRSGSPDCVPDCTTARDYLFCGMSDGCGGTCTGDNLCAFLVRRPEFIVVLQ